MKRIALIWRPDPREDFPLVVTDDPDVEVFEVNKGCINDPVYRLTVGKSLQRVSSDVFDALLGPKIGYFDDEISKELIQVGKDGRPIRPAGRSSRKGKSVQKKTAKRVRGSK